MKKQPYLAIPAQKALRKLGRDIRNARRRRRIPMQLMAERANFSRITLGKIEQGDQTVSMGAYVAALFVLGMINNLGQLADASHDLPGRELEEENLPQRIRIPKISYPEKNNKN